MCVCTLLMQVVLCCAVLYFKWKLNQSECKQTKAFTPLLIYSLVKRESLQRRKTFYETIQTVSQCMRFFLVVSRCHPRILWLARIHIYISRRTHNLYYTWITNIFHLCVCLFLFLLLFSCSFSEGKRSSNRRKVSSESTKKESTILSAIAFPPLFSACSQFFPFYLFLMVAMLWCGRWWWWW